MSEEFSKTVAKYEPGTLDKTRKNIGNIDPEEAKRMSKLLGGEVFVEKQAPLDTTAIQKTRNTGYIHRPPKSDKPASAPTARSATAGGADAAPKKKPSDTLPNISNDVRILMDKQMMSQEYRIKSNYGLFNFVRRFMRGKTEHIRHEFIERSIPRYLDYLQAFITATRSLIQIAPDLFRVQLQDDNSEPFKFLRTIAAWDIKTLRAMSDNLSAKSDNITVVNMIPFIRALYRMVMKIYYLGEVRITNIIKGIYQELSKHPESDKKKLLVISKDMLSQWLKVYSETIKGTYPLLLRMCSTTFESFPTFFTTRSSNILTFLEFTKYDIMTPTKKGAQPDEEGETQEPEEEKKSEKEQKEDAERKAKESVREAGIRLLEQLFPDAGFDRLDTMPDMYPYFQPLYQFRDGFNLLDPLNPMQVTVVLMRIIEDLFHGCRNIKFTEDAFDPNEEESLGKVMADWSQYREVLFERNYCDELLNFAREQYSKSDFKNSLFGKKQLTSVLWQTKYNFLPHFKFQQLLLEKPQNDSQFRPLCLRVSSLRGFFEELSHNIDGAAKTKGDVLGIYNPWDRYHFDIPNIVSKRMDVLLGAKKPAEETAATNANLIKYTLCLLTVLDWWVNDQKSPAYLAGSDTIYRISEEDGNIAFGVPLRKDQNKLFAERIKAAAARQDGASAQPAQAQAQPQPQQN